MKQEQALKPYGDHVWSSNLYREMRDMAVSELQIRCLTFFKTHP
jgi:hypothetical protein